jgi:hypothetical protein
MPALVCLPYGSASRQDARPPSRDVIRPSFEIDVGPQQRAQGKPGVRCTRSLACESEEHASKVTTGSPEQAGLPCADGFTTYSVLSPAIGLFVTVAGDGLYPRQLRASVEALRPHGFVVRFRMRSSCAR